VSGIKQGLDKMELLLKIALMLVQLAAFYGAVSYKLGKIESKIEMLDKELNAVSGCQDEQEKRLYAVEADVKMLLSAELHDEKHRFKNIVP
jgi:peptidoglycan hydrolase CwlO-like protein